MCVYVCGPVEATMPNKQCLKGKEGKMVVVEMWEVCVCVGDMRDRETCSRRGGGKGEVCWW